MFKVDLHTHSYASPDGGITAKQYEHILSSGVLDLVAITDHGRIDAAVALHEILGDKIIIGEEIMTSHGEIVGLYLKKPIPSGLPPLDTVLQIHEQGGLVLIPHPFETVRKGLDQSQMSTIADHIDIIETCNGRALNQKHGSEAVVWARLHNIIGVANSDAHGIGGLGKTYTSINSPADRDGLLKALSTGTLITSRPSVKSLLYPKYHRLRKKITRSGNGQ